MPPALSIEAAKALAQGASKYGPFNWRTGPRITMSLYLAAIRRHLDAFQDGEDDAPDSGISHLAHIAATVGILLDALALGNALDDRVSGPASDLLNDQDSHLKAKEAVERTLTVGTTPNTTVTLGHPKFSPNVNKDSPKVPPPEAVLPLVDPKQRTRTLNVGHEDSEEIATTPYDGVEDWV